MWSVKAATIVAWFSIIVIAAAAVFSIYVLSIPCVPDRICEMPPVHLFFLLALIISVICNFIGIILSIIGLKKEEPIKKLAKEALRFNGKIIIFSFATAMFLLLILIA
ncbi:hypothetical protein GCM10025882_40040 [Acinetobacter gyllenbergii]|uniref:Uncharacterized protein n=1 Tax=Acinetobacter gyllenbergii CIP 110306 = MTCC 11365 TaxID=1217657 RepID=A0A829HID9_9GAMM|nr:hypothetical protein [Acinetobacter gyllenbergii]EPF80162.1 hypothetical protein F957_02235 [Acinetobacter gyllenbergii CIP 110306 = MTCC 11365]ESK53248.1 hypothetical protein F987_01174 [Acinetobacter gyllenbergii NIPH 230]MCU4580470.1 hypothetical protein [Acinetobacter gyllenbergii]OBY75090.1 hypothetical protein NG55_08240 [Acinetobacter gyllenbergii]GMA13577.1 hypothetical protein GCM10025882_40040 [Acinetobacter gyllenbergii]